MDLSKFTDLSDEAWKALTIIIPSLTVVISRVISNREHRKTGNKVNDIYMIVNGGLQKKLDEAYERGKTETEEKLKSK